MQLIFLYVFLSLIIDNWSNFGEEWANGNLGINNCKFPPKNKKSKKGPKRSQEVAFQKNFFCLF
jgi:hypothetical protein